MPRNSIERPHKIYGSYVELNFKIIKDDRLTWADKAYYAILLDRSSYEDRGWSFQTHETMVEFGFSLRYSKTISKKLHDLGFIDKKRSKNGFVSIPTELYKKTSLLVTEDPQVEYMKVVKR